MQPWGELMSACGDELWDIGEGGTGGKDGKESAVTYTSRGVWTARPNGDTCSTGQHSWTLLSVPAFLSVVPTTQYWSVVRVWARQSAQWGDVPVCHGAMDSKQNVNVSGRREVGCTSLPAWRHFHTCCYVRWALHLGVKVQSWL